MAKRRSVRPRRIFESEQRVEFHFPQQAESFLEMFFGLAGKAQDDVGGDADLALGGADQGDFFEILFAGVSASHSAQNFRGARLHREMDVIT